MASFAINSPPLSIPLVTLMAVKFTSKFFYIENIAYGGNNFYREIAGCIEAFKSQV